MVKDLMLSPQIKDKANINMSLLLFYITLEILAKAIKHKYR